MHTKLSFAGIEQKFPPCIFISGKLTWIDIAKEFLTYLKNNLHFEYLSQIYPTIVLYIELEDIIIHKTDTTLS